MDLERDEYAAEDNEAEELNNFFRATNFSGTYLVNINRMREMEKLIKGIKPILSDKKLKTGLVKLAIVTIVLLFTMSAVGTISAKQKRNFPIYTDGTVSYAIVYFS